MSIVPKIQINVSKKSKIRNWKLVVKNNQDFNSRMLMLIFCLNVLYFFYYLNISKETNQ